MNARTTPTRIHLTIWAILMVLLLLTWGLAQINLHALNIVAALAIAVVKMLLVILYFMHVRSSPRLTWLFVSAGFIWFLILVGLTLTDYLTRGVVSGE